MNYLCKKKRTYVRKNFEFNCRFSYNTFLFAKLQSLNRKALNSDHWLSATEDKSKCFSQNFSHSKTTEKF